MSEQRPLPQPAYRHDPRPLGAVEPPWTKTISQSRNHLQSSVLTILVGAATLLAVLWRESTLLFTHRFSPAPLLLSSVFGLLAWRLRAATRPAAFMGAAICLLLAQPTRASSAHDTLLAPGLHALIALFAITFLATRFGRARKERRGLAERRTGRRAAQVLANLGTAAIFAATGHLLGALAAMAEATADTVSSEIGQATAGPTWLLTTGRRVPAGTDGGLSLIGTLAGSTAALFMAIVVCLTLHQLATFTIIFFAGCFGLVFDSLLGATIERRGWIGNDVVNLLSTIAAALCALLLWHLHHATPHALLSALPRTLCIRWR